VVLIRGSDGRLLQFFTQASRRRVTIGFALSFVTYSATVTALGGVNDLRGPSSDATLAGIRHGTRRHPHTHKLPHLPGQLVP
jgi:hypothetical protein